MAPVLANLFQVRVSPDLVEIDFQHEVAGALPVMATRVACSRANAEALRDLLIQLLETPA